MNLLSTMTFLAQASEDYSVTTTNTEVSPAAAAIGGIIWLALVIFLIAAMWKVFTKAGQPGWASIIPIYNIYVLLKIAGKPGWWLLLFFIPLLNIIMAIIVMISLAESFGKGAGFGLGLAFLSPIFFPILGFGDATYQGPRGAASLPVGA